MFTKIKKAFLIAIIILANVFIASVTPALADTTTASSCVGTTTTNPLTFFPTWYDGLDCGNGNIKSPGDPSLGSDSGKRFGTWLTIIAMNIVRMLLYVVGYASIIFIIYGGFKYMTQGDNSSGTVAARKTIQNAVIGLVLSVMSVSIVTFVVGQVSNAGSGGNCSVTSTGTGSTGTTGTAGTSTATTTIQLNKSDLNLTGASCTADQSTVGKLLGIAYLVAGIVAVLAIILGGVRYTTANGDSSQIQAAKNTILYAVVGLVVIIMASAITSFVLTQITKT